MPKVQLTTENGKRISVPIVSIELPEGIILE